MPTSDSKRQDSDAVVAIRTTRNPSRQHAGMTHTRTPADGANAHEMAKARYLVHERADRVFGDIVSTELVKDILRKFIDDGVVHVFEGANSCSGDRDLKVSSSPNSDDVQRAIQLAFESTHRHGSILSKALGGNDEEWKQKVATCTFKWTTFPVEPLKGDEFIKFMDDITDRVFAIVKPRLATENIKFRRHFVVVEDKDNIVTLSCGSDGENTVDINYVNLAKHLVDGSDNKDLKENKGQMQRYMCGLKCPRPWMHYTLRMAITEGQAVFSTRQDKGSEDLKLILSDGRGCIEFIRILLGLVLADQGESSRHQDAELEEQICMAENVAPHSVQSRVETSSRTTKDEANSISDRLQIESSQSVSMTCLGSGGALDVRSVLLQPSLKRTRSTTDDANPGVPKKKRKIDKGTIKTERLIFYPISVHGYQCTGIMFTYSAVIGQGTTVFCAVDLCDEKKVLALKTAWQGLGQAAGENTVTEKLRKYPHPNVIVPIEMFKPELNGKTCTTLDVIRGFHDDPIEKMGPESGVLAISMSELKRPVKYFWGVHDFVRGLRGALLGHAYLTEIGVLHRDISENNIVLGRRPGDQRGYLIDFDRAILQEREEPFPDVSDTDSDSDDDSHSLLRSTPPKEDKKPAQPERNGTVPYMSYNVLWGGKHTQFDDIESFLYVLFLFFFSYAGPLSVEELRDADKNGFAQPIESKKLPHLRVWPEIFADWINSPDEKMIAAWKYHTITTRNRKLKRVVQSPEFVDCLKNNWPEDLHSPIRRLIRASFRIFFRSTVPRTNDLKGSRTEVTHAAFTETLDKWLDKYSHLEDKFSNCPFKQGNMESP